MKFIIPKNYSFKYKIFGFIDYTTAILDLIIGFLLFIILGFIVSDLIIKLYIFIILFLPIFLFSIFGLGKENFISVIFYILKFIKKSKIYLYKNIE